MPEGPSIVILKESVQEFKGRKITSASGTLKTFDVTLLEGKKILDFRTWGKHFLICFKDFTIKIHLLMFGHYAINLEEQAEPRLHLGFAKGELNFYTCSVTLIEKPLDEVYDWTADVMNKHWDTQQALLKLKSHRHMLICDTVLDQNIFSGVGNIIKNEVLFNVRIHPKSMVGKIPAVKKKQLIAELVHYSFQFLEWKKEGTLKKHWLAHTKKECPRDHVPLKKEYLGKTKRRSFFCSKCQKVYQ